MNHRTDPCTMPGQALCRCWHEAEWRRVRDLILTGSIPPGPFRLP